MLPPLNKEIYVKSTKTHLNPKTTIQPSYAKPKIVQTLDLSDDDITPSQSLDANEVVMVKIILFLHYFVKK